MEYSTAERDFLLKTTCQLIRRRVEGATSPLQVTPLTLELMKPAGIFVSLYTRQGHALRGCIGRVDTALPMLEALVNIAWQVSADPRFANNPVRLPELPSLAVELSILGPLKPSPTPLDFEPGVDGMLMQIATRFGVFLPQVARETGWSREELLDHLCQEKLGVPPRSWKESNARLFTFPTLTLGPVDFIME
jgi:AmmeMemoRadiSam system protein A